MPESPNQPHAGIELSVVLPCLNEQDTLASCIGKAQQTLREHQIAGEVLVSDNGSTDDSPAIAERCGARLLRVPRRTDGQPNGYGHGLMHGIRAARGTFVVMGDSDDSYDFGEIPRFLDKLRQGYELVQGCRLPAGGGTIRPGAMPWSHRWIGNPLFSLLVRRWFGAPVTDVNCGLRAFRKDWFERMDLRCLGMEFAAEMIIKAGLFKSRIAEVPVTLRPDGRKAHAPHLKTFRDGWRIQRLLFVYSPSWLFLIPGLLLMALGALGYALALPGLRIHGVQFDAHTLLFSSALILCGYQAILYSTFSKTFAANEGLAPPHPGLQRFYRIMNLERGLLLGLLLLAPGLALAGKAVLDWARTDFGDLSYAHMMRIVIPATLLIILGIQTIFSSFFTSVLGLARNRNGTPP